MNVIKEFKNDLLKRREIEVSNEYEKNPGFVLVTKDIATQFKVSEDVVVVRRVGSSFGTNEFVVDFFIYDSSEDKEKVEPKKKEKRGAKK